ncbi:MAG: GNAT family N-acetyltransferase [Acutalibacteraceae bacterium]
MNFIIRKADRGDLKDILALTYAVPPVIDRTLVDRFDDILSQTGFCLLVAFMNGRPAGLLSVSVTDGIGKQFPFAVTDSGIIGGEFQGLGIEDALIARAQYIAAEYGCKSIRSK